MSTSLQTTILDILKWRRTPSAGPSALSIPNHFGQSTGNVLDDRHAAIELNAVQPPSSEEVGDSTRNEELKLPRISSLIVVLMTSTLLQISFFIIVSSSNLYAQHLGGGSTFSGLVIGIPTLFSGIVLIPLMKVDKNGYKLPLHVACFTSVLGNILYALAYKANFLYLILIGRIVSGFSFSFWMYAKKYCTDPRLVGVRRRTTLAGWVVVGQGLGFTLGPFLGGALYRTIGFGANGNKDIFNGFTSPAWIMAVVWLVFWAAATVFYEEDFESDSRIHSVVPQTNAQGTESRSLGNHDDHRPAEAIQVDAAPRALLSPFVADWTNLSFARWGAIITMCWFAMTCFFILGAWESNIPVFSASAISSLHWSPFDAGNLIAMGGATIFPFLFLNIYLGPRIQDRLTLVVGSLIGFIGLVVFLAELCVSTADVRFPVMFISWVLVALGFNLASTCTLTLLSKQLPGEWNGRLSLAIQYSNYLGRVTGAVWGASGVIVGMKGYVGLEMALIGIGAALFSTLWKDLKTKTG